MSTDHESIDRREAVRRVSALLGGLALVGGSGLLEGSLQSAHARTTEVTQQGVGTFTKADVAYLDEIADTILPPTKTPGAKATRTGAFMALMVTDSYEPRDQQLFRDGMTKLDAESRKSHGVPFVRATPKQRLALLERVDREAKSYTEAREIAIRKGKEGDKYLPDQRKEQASAPDASAAPAVTADSPAHYFRMMKELALLGYFTSQIGCTQAQRYVESPGRFDPCVPYKKGETAWAPHA